MDFNFELLLIPIAYLIGSISFAVVVSKCMCLPDPHSYGSGNPGATNVLRTGNKRAAVLTLLGDALKGYIAVMFNVPIVVPFCCRFIDTLPCGAVAHASFDANSPMGRT